MPTEQPQPVQSLEYAGPSSDEFYQDRIKGWRRRFTVAEECLIIQARQFSGCEYESRVSLRDIDPVYSIVRQRTLNPILCVLLAVFVFIALFMLAPFAHGRPSIIQTMTRAPILIAAGLTTLIVLRSLAGIELYQFRYTGGHFDIARNGPDKKRFDAFVERLLARIDQAQHPVFVSKTTNS
jgi:hypothetical protein